MEFPICASADDSNMMSSVRFIRQAISPRFRLPSFILLVSISSTIVLLFFVYNLGRFSFLLDLDHLFKRVFHVPPVDRCNHSPVLSGAVDSSSCQFPLAIRTELATELDWNDFSAVSRTKLLINRFVLFLFSNSFL